MIDADMAFHRAIYVASRNPLIEPSAYVHWHHIQRAMGAVLQRSVLRSTVWDEHAASAQAIAAGGITFALADAGLGGPLGEPRLVDLEQPIAAVVVHTPSSSR